MKTDSAAPVLVPGDTEELDRELLQVARDIAAVSWDLKALNTVIIDLRGRVSYTDFVIVCTGTSERQVNSLARNIDDAMKQAGRQSMGSEGTDNGRWALLDYGDIIVHIFHQNARKDYDLERMWSDAPRVELEDAPPELYGHFGAEQFEQA